MNVYVATVDGLDSTFLDAAVSFDAVILEVVKDDDTTRFPLCNVISFTTNEVSA